ncbi:uncharacterized protein LOC117299803 [Asterias rubens]|uniref:uncharacterized protein LOC117299803 n=1 Tax=Asterias rubens TaxID=7604 RepID=UPI001454F66F|nr:uncharacterized protein LOC117299803 [Asterias rubens]
MASNRFSFLLPVVVLLLAGVGSLMSISYTNAVTTPQPREIQYYGTERVGTMVAVIMAFVIVPLGVFGFIMIFICNIIIYCKKSRQAKTPSFETKPPFDDDIPDEVKQWSDTSDTEDEKEISTFYMFMETKNDIPDILSPANM